MHVYGSVQQSTYSAFPDSRLLAFATARAFVPEVDGSPPVSRESSTGWCFRGIQTLVSHH